MSHLLSSPPNRRFTRSSSSRQSQVLVLRHRSSGHLYPLTWPITCSEDSLSSLSPGQFLWPSHLGQAWLSTKLVNVFSNSHVFWRHCCCQNNWGERVREAEYPAVPRKFLTAKCYPAILSMVPPTVKNFLIAEMSKSFMVETEIKHFSRTPYDGHSSAPI